MSTISTMISGGQLKKIGIGKAHVNYQLSHEELTEQTLQRGEGVLNDTGALCIKTGEFTGRSPKDKFIVKDSITGESVFWNSFNIAIDEKYFFQLKDKLTRILDSQVDIWMRDCCA